jgi:hypothetical protein
MPCPPYVVEFGRLGMIAHRSDVWCAPVQTRPDGRPDEPGSRNATLNRAAFNLGQLVTDGLLDAGEVRAVLLAAALAAGNPEAKARATIESGLRGGITKPRRRRDGAA